MCLTLCRDNQSISKHFIIKYNSILHHLAAKATGYKSKSTNAATRIMAIAIAAILAVTFPWGSEVFGCVWAKQWHQGHVCCKWFATSPKNTAFPHWTCFPAASVLVLQCSAFVDLFPVFWESWAHCPILPKFPIQKHPNFHFFWVPLSSNAMSSSPTHHTWWSLRVPRALLRHDVQVHLRKSRHQKHSKTIKHNQKQKKINQELSAFPNMLAGVVKFSVQPESLSFIQ